MSIAEVELIVEVHPVEHDVLGEGVRKLQRKAFRHAPLQLAEGAGQAGGKNFLQERQAVYRRLGLSLARIMNYDPPDPEWNPAKEKFYEIYWGEIPLVADEAVMKVVEPFSDVLHRAETKQDKEAFTNQVSAITEACRKSLGDAWKDIKKAEEQSSHV